MSTLTHPATLDLVWTLAATGGLLGLGLLTLFALPWTDREIASMDSAFRSMGEVTSESIPLHTAG